MKNEMNYIGPSMNPTLKAGDWLEIVPYENRPIRIGDVVVFRDPEGKNAIVHRVIASGLEGLRTRGDNNDNPDPWLLKPEDIVGRVASIKRKKNIKTIHGEARGFCRARMLWFVRNVDKGISRMLHPAYRRLASSGFFRNLTFFLPRIQIVTFKKPEGNELQILLKGIILAKFTPKNGRWHIARPFRLIIDESRLPFQSGMVKGYRTGDDQGACEF